MTRHAAHSSGCFFRKAWLLAAIISLVVCLPIHAAGVDDSKPEQNSEAYVPARQDVESRYDQGKFYFNQLQDNAILAENRDNWLKCISIFQDIYLENPSHSLAPASLYMICRTRLRMFDRFQDAEDLDAAIGQLQNLVNLFPNNRLADDALFALGQLYLDNKKDQSQAARYFSRVVGEYPSGDMYTLAAQKMQQLSQEFGIALPDSMIGRAPDKLNTIFPARHWSSPQYGRIVVSASGPVAYKDGLLSGKAGKSRLYIDFADSYTAPADRGAITVADGGLLRSVSAEQKTGDSVRVLVEAEHIEHYEIYSLPDPFRVVIDVRGKAKKSNLLSKSVPKPPPAKIDEAATKNAPRVADAALTGQKTPVIEEKAEQAAAKSEPPKSRDKKRKNDSSATAEIAPPASNASSGKALSLAQQLGLGVKKIVLDPGHGGKDPGATAGGLKEKDVALAVAKKLKPALEQELGCEVVLTREDDRFLGLEERTAFANTQGADLFLSLHLNAHSSSKADGFETYYLNLTTSPEAMRVAALENATSTHQLSDLQDILSSIMKNSKIAESSRLARQVNDAVVTGVSGETGDKIKNHGVKQAPFYVLIGAQMPAILLELAFISNPEDARRITSDDYVAAMTKHIAKGIAGYVNSNTTALR
ncbi:MAG: N-acetylmuramoyl-L-alanine amidase [Desulfobulbaceae bacterium]|nr:N-acetylmuramoyl-L-alanine amidase [Desulfobulbaceae bacterium]